MDDQNKNLILAVALSGLVMLVWAVWFAPEVPEQPLLPPSATVASQSDTQIATPSAADQNATTAGTPDATIEKADAPRISIDTPRLQGSISLQGGRIDDLSLKDYRETLDPQSDFVRLLSPVGSEHPYYAVYGWAPGGQLQDSDVPGPNTEWTLESGSALGLNTPISLKWDNGAGLIFHRTIAIDANYMFTVEQSVENTGTAAVRLAPYGLLERRRLPELENFFVLHEGVVRLTDDELSETKYKKMPDMDFVEREGARAEVTEVQENGWIGFTDKNWMTTLVPMPGQSFRAAAKYSDRTETYQTYISLPTLDVAPGTTSTAKTMLFSGAKEWEAIRDYEKNRGIKKFVDSIDWGWFYFLTKPIFMVLHWLNGLIGNMGWSIIALTLLIKAILFPLAYKSYVSMAKMKELQPRMAKIKEKVGDDRAKLQQETMALYKAEKVNPAAGCLPLILQIPIFFSLYKVIFVTIELRHAPWFGWIRDLSAPDPSSILNLFGLLPNGVPGPDSALALISLGILPILLGISMYLQQKLNPAPADPAQAMIFAWMPWVFMFMLGRFASGLVIYWIANNMITFTQQYIIMRSHGHKPDVLGNIFKTFKRKDRDAK
ncbi:MAG: membrane protein insertase YidC [Paracoccaceae bacterium]